MEKKRNKKKKEERNITVITSNKVYAIFILPIHYPTLKRLCCDIFIKIKTDMSVCANGDVWQPDWDIEAGKARVCGV